MKRIVFLALFLLSLCAARGQTFYTYRYWLDNDVATLHQASATGACDLTLDVSGMSTGTLHAVHVQPYTTAGGLGSVRTLYFLIPDELNPQSVTGRYWLDNDEKTLQEASTLSGTFAIDPSTLSTGIHAIHYQTFAKDGETASPVRTQYFLVSAQGLQHLTCSVWIDDNEAEAQVYNVTADGIEMDVSELSQGMHEAHVALFDADGAYVDTRTVTFEVKPKMHLITLTESMEAYCCEVDLDFSDVKGLTAYTVTGYNAEDGTVNMSRAADVPAGTGLVLKGEPGKYLVPECLSHSHYANLLVGAQTDTTLDTADGTLTNFALTTGADGTAFCVADEGAVMGAGLSYLPLSTEGIGSVTVLGLKFFDGNATQPYDVNGDGLVNISDVTALVNQILGK